MVDDPVAIDGSMPHATVRFDYSSSSLDISFKYLYSDTCHYWFGKYAMSMKWSTFGVLLSCKPTTYITDLLY